MKRIIALFLALTLCLGLAACAKQGPDVLAPAQEAEEAEPTPPTPGIDPTPAPEDDSAADAEEAEAEETADEPEAEETADGAEKTADAVNVMVLNGTTGFGMAKLMADAAEGKAQQDYAFSVETDASNVTAELISGGCDIAALPTNAAATVYAKTEGGVQLLALNTRGVLYLVVNSKALSVSSLDELDGMTVYVPAQNPSFVFQAICKAAGVDVTVDNTYAQPADLRTALAAGEIDLAVLPEPMVTIACAANEDLTVALDLTEQWDDLYPAGSLVLGCVVARTEFAESDPGAVETFLAEYGDSIAYLQSDPAAAAQLIEQTGVFTNAAVAEKAIPRCNVCFVTGEEMKEDMQEYLQTLYDLAPESVGGALPEDGFYYLGQ